MARMVAVSELKAQCLRLVDEVARRRREIVVTKRGKPIARMVPLDDVPPDAALTRLRGTVMGGDRVEDFDTGLVWKAARG
ncbi:MAG: type II toxin-antitoxin system Phd/YefM family antitoxin [Candidatus Binatia bacterium]